MKKVTPVSPTDLLIKKYIKLVVDLVGKRYDYNDRCARGRNIKWFGPEVSDRLKKHLRMDIIILDAAEEGIEVSISSMVGWGWRGGSSRVHIKRMKNEYSKDLKEHQSNQGSTQERLEEDH